MMPRRFLPFLSLMVVLIMACGLGAKPLDSRSLTLTPMSQLVRETLTARAGAQGGASNELATAVAQATEKSEQIYATQTARASLNEPARLASVTAMAPAVAELPRYGVDPASGYVAWIHNPATIDLNGFNQTGYANDYPQITAADFVLAADIKWNTRNSLSGCGFMFRSDGNQNNPNQYSLIITRVASGHMGFLAIANGEISNYREYFIKNGDRSFDWLNGSTNRLALVARGNSLDFYTNGNLIGQVDITQPPPPTILDFAALEIPAGLAPGPLEQFQSIASQNEEGSQQVQDQLGQAQKNFSKNKPFFYDGLLGFLGLSQSGQMTCEFSNSWLFILNQ
jgi:hypothetical protein